MAAILLYPPFWVGVGEAASAAAPWILGALGVAVTTKAVSNHMANAENKAQEREQSGTAVDTCATGNCSPLGPNCDERNKAIKERIDELKDRFQALQDDRNNLFYNHYFNSQSHATLGSYEGHIQQYDAKQKNLRRQIQAAKDARCSVNEPDAEDWATNSPPQSPKFRYPTPAPPP